MVFVLSKVDLLTDEFDRANLLVQLTQNLSGVIPTKGFKVHPLVLPSFLEDSPKADVLKELNKLDEIQEMFLQALSRRAQTSVHAFRALVQRAESVTQDVLTAEKETHARNAKLTRLSMLSMFLLLVGVAAYIYLTGFVFTEGTL
ncbi:hypothetical protein KIPB_008944 [Kipferlia bialata]|uniref:Uncharacterized protein n=1 Tax=Kipferlia bialata TaxID=797122 RepID=A0A9K3D2F1_9EUKA|nr:hypothetical protein KIPB_008944 [Kipferlia bialata]|eukprot:g8944.t1